MKYMLLMLGFKYDFFKRKLVNGKNRNKQDVKLSLIASTKFNPFMI